MARRASLTLVPVPPLAPERFREILTSEQAAELDQTIQRGHEVCNGRAIWSVNSTARGGGVAELLRSLIAYTRGAGVDARWVVIDGTPQFFRLTKRLHNLLHGSPGDGGQLGEEEDELYRQVSQANAAALARLTHPGDIVLLHDPQTAGLVAPLKELGLTVVWRCHVGADLVNDYARDGWRFLLPRLGRADAYVFSREAFAWHDLDQARVAIIPPSIDAFSPKNQAMEPDTVSAVLRVAGLESGDPPVIPAFVHVDGTPGRVDRRAEVAGGSTFPPDAPIVTQVSRWDRLKGHDAVLDAFERKIGRQADAHLVLAGPAATAVADDPEGLEVLAELSERWRACPAEVRERVHLASLPMEDAEENAAIVNALQRRSDVLVQKSHAEGFGLTVAEAMWKGRPVVASRVGGIADQIVEGETGLLVDPDDDDGFAAAVTRLLDDRDEAGRLGRAARERVRDSFLGPRHLRQYVDLLAALLAARVAEPAAQGASDS